MNNINGLGLFLGGAIGLYYTLYVIGRGRRRKEIAEWAHFYDFPSYITSEELRNQMWRDYEVYKDTSFWHKMWHEMPNNMERAFSFIDFEDDNPYFYKDDVASTFLSLNPQKSST